MKNGWRHLNKLQFVFSLLLVLLGLYGLSPKGSIMHGVFLINISNLLGGGLLFCILIREIKSNSLKKQYGYVRYFNIYGGAVEFGCMLFFSIAAVILSDSSGVGAYVVSVAFSIIYIMLLIILMVEFTYGRAFNAGCNGIFKRKFR